MKGSIIKTCAGVCLVLIACIQASGQDINFSQYYNVPTYYNPAMVGLYTGIRARFDFRDQYPNLPDDFKGYFFSAELGDRRLPGSGGVGLIFNTDDEGLAFIRNLTVGLNLSVRIQLTPYLITQVGIKAAYLQKTLNWKDFVFGDQLDPKYGYISDQTKFQHPEYNRVAVPDFGFGALLQGANDDQSIIGTFGISIDHLFSPDLAFLATGSDRLPKKWVIQADGVFTVGGSGRNSDNGVKINPGFIFQNQGEFKSLQFGSNFYKYNIYLGVFYKSIWTKLFQGSLVLTAGYRYDFNEDFSLKFCYNYDLQTNVAIAGTGGAHEITLSLDFNQEGVFDGSRSYKWGNSRRGSKGGRFECPDFH